MLGEKCPVPLRGMRSRKKKQLQSYSMAFLLKGPGTFSLMLLATLLVEAIYTPTYWFGFHVVQHYSSTHTTKGHVQS